MNLNRLYSYRLTSVLKLLSVIPLVVIVLITFFDVFARYLFASPIKGSMEVVEFSMALVVFTALPLVTLKRAHITVSLIDGLFTGVWWRVKLALCDLLSAAALVLLTTRLWAQAQDQMEYGETTLVLELPFWSLYWTMSILSGLTAIIVLAMAVNALLGKE